MRNYSLSIKLFVSLSLLLVVTVIILGTISNYAVISSSETEISKNCISKLKVAENTVLQLKDTITKDTIRVSVTGAIKDLSGILENNKLFVDTQNLFVLSKVVDAITEITSTNSSYHSVYLYLEDLGYSFTSGEGFVSNSNLKDTGWLKSYQEYKTKGTALSWTATRMPGGGTSEPAAPDYVITYIYPLTPYTTNLHGALVVNIREQVISRLINSENFNREGYIFIINNKGDVISHVDQKYLSRNVADKSYVKSIMASKENDGYIVSDIDGSRSLVSYHKSSNNDWIYIGMFSLDSLVSRVNGIRMLTVYVSMLLVILGIAAAFLISRRLYSPVKKLVQDIKSTKGIDLLENDNEMTVLSKAFETLKKHEENLFNTLEKNKRNIFENYLNNLIRGNHADEYDSEFLQLDFKYAGFVCAVMSIDNYKEFVKEFTQEQQYYFKILILNVAEEVINAEYVCKGLSLHRGELALIINLPQEAYAEVETRLRKCFEDIQRELTKIFDHSVSVGVGGCHKGEQEVKQSFLEANEAIKSKMKYGYGSVTMWHKELAEHKYYYPFNVEKYILNYMGIKDIEGIENTLKGLMEEIRGKAGLSSDNVIQIFNQLVGNTVVKFLVETHMDMSHVFGSGFNIYNELSTKETLDDILLWLVEVYGRVLGHSDKTDNISKDKLDVIMDYIHKHYKNDIGIREIAEHANLSYSHARKIFKDATGENIVDYINGIRIKDAKELLEYTDIIIRDISLSLGYNNDQSFTRAFKKLEGITPGEYRGKKFMTPSLKSNN